MINQGLVASCDKIGNVGLLVFLKAAPHLTAV